MILGDGSKKVGNKNRGRGIRHRQNINSSKKIIIGIVVIVLAIISVIIFAVVRGNYKDFNNIKLSKDDYLVYTKYEKKTDNLNLAIPYINIKGEVVSKVNEDIALFTYDFAHAEKAKILYEYDINGIILSVVVKAIDYEVLNNPVAYFRSYNINLETLEVISDEALLDFYSIDLESVRARIENTFRYYYQELSNEKYFDVSECDYQCFLENRGIDDYLDGVSYYVKDGDLVAFKSFLFNSIYSEEDYFKDDDFMFVLVQSAKNDKAGKS